MKRLTTLFAALVLVSSVFSQSFEWAKFHRTYGCAADSRIASDNAGNVYTFSNYCTKMTIDGDTISGTYGGVADDLFLTKFSVDGILQWSKRFGTTWYDPVKSIAVDAAGHIYVSFSHQGGPIMFEDTTIAVGAPPGYPIIQFDSNGNFLRHHVYPGSFALHLATLGNDLYVAHDYFVIKHDSLFNTIWSRMLNPTNILVLTGLYVSESGYLAVSGYEAGAGTTTIDTVSMTFDGAFNDVGIILMDTSGTAFWGRILNHTNQYGLQSSACAVDDNGNVFWEVKFHDLVIFGSDTMSGPVLPDYSALLKYDAAGNEQWGVPLYSYVFQPELFDLVVDDQQQIVVVGTYGGYYGTNSNSFGGIPLPQGVSLIVSKVDQAGDVVWVKTDNATANGSSEGYSMALMPGDKYAVTARVSEPEQFGCFMSPLQYSVLTTAISDAPEPVPVVDFDFANEGGTYYFHNTTQNDGNPSWNFGDGSPVVSTVNPTHYFDQGAWAVCLTVTNSCGSGMHCDTIIVPGINRVLPNRVAHTGYHLIGIEGGFDFSSADVVFKKAGAPDIIPDTIILRNNGLIQVNLKLNHAIVGVYDVIVSSAGFADTLFQSFTIEEPTSQDVEISITPPYGKHLISTYRKYKVTLINHGNQTLVGVPFYLLLDGDFNVLTKTFITADSITQDVIDTIGGHFGPYTDSITNESYHLGHFLAYALLPEQPYSFEMYLEPQSFGAHQIQAFVGPAIFDSLDLVNMNLRTACNFLPLCMQCALDLAGFIPGAPGCIVGAFNFGCAVGNDLRKGGSDVQEAQQTGDVLMAGAGVALGCAGVADEALEVVTSVSNATVHTTLGIGGELTEAGLHSGTLGPGGACNPFGGGCNPYDVDDWITIPVASYDPNGKSGPEGLTPENYINTADIIEYSIYFENADTATAPATFVELIDTIDVTKFEMSTFRFSGFGFGDSSYLIQIPDNSFAANIDLRPAKHSILRVMGSLDTLTGIMTWGFYSLDTLTLGLNEDPDQGFLNPNVVSPEGEGFISYSLKPRLLPHLTTIANRAAIVFDYNAAIITPDWINTIDLVAPQSHITITPNVWPDSAFVLHFNGTDAHAGVYSYEVYMSRNDSGFVRIGLITQDSVRLRGIVGDNFKFYSIAIDHVGNREDAPATHDAEITISNPDGITDPRFEGSIEIIPNPFATGFNLVINSPTSSEATIVIRDFLGREILLATKQLDLGMNTLALELPSTAADGLYLLQAEFNGQTWELKLAKQ